MRFGEGCLVLCCSEFFLAEGFFDGGVGVDEAVASFVVYSWGGDVCGGGGDDFLEVPGEEVWVCGEHEGDGAAEHGTGEGVAVEFVWVDFSVWGEEWDFVVEGADFWFLDGAVFVVFCVPFDWAFAGEGGSGEVLLDSSGGEDGFWYVFWGAHLDWGLGGLGEVTCAGYEVEAAEGAVFHDFSPVGAVLSEVWSGEAHAVGVCLLLDGPLDGGFYAGGVDDACP